MIPAPVLVQLGTIGLSPDQLAAVAEMLRTVEEATITDLSGRIEVAEEEALRLARAKNADRQARFRERQAANSNVTSDNLTLRNVTKRYATRAPTRAPGLLFEERVEESPVDAKKRQQPPRGRDDENSRARRLPKDWLPSEAHRSQAAALGLTPLEHEEIATEFQNYWWSEGGQKARKIDWERTYTNRLNEQAKRVLKGKQNGRRRTVHDAARDLCDYVDAGGKLNIPPIPPVPSLFELRSVPTSPSFARLLPER
jgi:hypothetical protein